MGIWHFLFRWQAPEMNGAIVTDFMTSENIVLFSKDLMEQEMKVVIYTPSNETSLYIGLTWWTKKKIILSLSFLPLVNILLQLLLVPFSEVNSGSKVTVWPLTCRSSGRSVCQVLVESVVSEVNVLLLQHWLSSSSVDTCRDVIQASPRGSSEKEWRFATSAATHANDCIRLPSINIKHQLVTALFLQESHWSSIFEQFNH